MNISPGDLIGPLTVLGIIPRRDGKSAYQVWLDAGHTGSVNDFLNSLVGPNGESAYQIWLSLGNSGTEQDFINSLVGPQGPTGSSGAPGESTYQAWLNAGNTGSEQDFLNSLIGPVGPAGTSFVVDKFQVTSQDLTNQYVTLSKVPSDPLKVFMTPFRGIMQESGVDFIVQNQTFNWSGLALQLLLEVNDTFVVYYLPQT